MNSEVNGISSLNLHQHAFMTSQWYFCIFSLLVIFSKKIFLMSQVYKHTDHQFLFSVPRGVGSRTDTGIYFIFYYLFEWIRSKSAPMGSYYNIVDTYDMSRPATEIAGHFSVM